jgi:anti-sigma regulatory factor (Ser/Thr protein kinase)
VNCPDIRIEVLSKPQLLKPIRELLRSYVAGCGYPGETAEMVVLAVDEACANAIRHAYRGCCDEQFEILLRSDAEGVEITLTDRGRPAPAERIAPRDVAPPDPATVKPGGLGLRLIYEVFDEVEFRPGEECGNRVTMKLKRPGSGGEA